MPTRKRRRTAKLRSVNDLRTRISQLERRVKRLKAENEFLELFRATFSAPARTYMFPAKMLPMNPKRG